MFFEDRSDQAILDDQFARLLTFPNVLITGHQGFFTAETLTNIAATTIANLDAFEQTSTALHPVTIEAPAMRAMADGLPASWPGPVRATRRRQPDFSAIGQILPLLLRSDTHVLAIEFLDRNGIVVIQLRRSGLPFGQRGACAAFNDGFLRRGDFPGH